MKRNMYYLVLSAVAMLAMLLSACGAAATTAAPATAAPATAAPATAAPATVAPATAAPATAAPTTRTYVLVPKNLGNPYFDAANTGAQKAATELGVKVLYQGPTTADATAQITMLDSLIAQKVSGLAISADDADALVPAGAAAIAAGIPVVTWDSNISKGGTQLFVNQADTKGIGDVNVKMALDLTGPTGGEIAILSATAQAPNQNAWIAVMKTDLATSTYSMLKLDTIAYGNDDDTTSYNQALALMKTYPNLKVIVAPTSVGIAAAGRAVKDQNMIGKVFVTGLGTPNALRDYVKSNIIPEFALWNVPNLGYLTIYALDAIATGKIKGQPGDTFTAGSLGSYTVAQDGTILLGPPQIFNKDNIDQFNY
ncbi:MAG: rhamnose ABC transporter substrate-binding protein [Anaerolineales bacterium]|jgi:rhamnose transport system substrate-binding protein